VKKKGRGGAEKRVSVYTNKKRENIKSFLLGWSMLYCILYIYGILFYSAMFIHSFCSATI
jgi:hypothetical protein